MKKKVVTLKELYDHITSQITPEQALMKLLEGAVREYEHLKFSEGKAVHPLIIIANAALDMGWNFAIEGGDQHEMRGLVTGTQEYMDTILKCEVGKASDLYEETPLQVWDELYEEIKHGEPEHQKWLRDKIDEFIKKRKNGGGDNME